MFTHMWVLAVSDGSLAVDETMTTAHAIRTKRPLHSPYQVNVAYSKLMMPDMDNSSIITRCGLFHQRPLIPQVHACMQQQYISTCIPWDINLHVSYTLILLSVRCMQHTSGCWLVDGIHASWSSHMWNPHAPNILYGQDSILNHSPKWPRFVHWLFPLQGRMPSSRGNKWAVKRGLLQDDSSLAIMFLESPGGTYLERIMATIWCMNIMIIKIVVLLIIFETSKLTHSQIVPKCGAIVSGWTLHEFIETIVLNSHDEFEISKQYRDLSTWRGKKPCSSEKVNTGNEVCSRVACQKEGNVRPNSPFVLRCGMNDQHMECQRCTVYMHYKC